MAIGRLVVILMALLVLMCRGAGAVDKQMFLQPDDLDRLNELIEQRWPPWAADVSINPETPEPDEAVEITVKAADHPEAGDDETSDVFVYFSVDDGETWEQFQLDEDEDDTWIGEFPGQPAETTVLYGIRIVNDSGSTYVEAVCKAPESPLKTNGSQDEDCFNAPDSEKCEEPLPVGCMFPLAAEEPPVDDQDALIPGIFDARGYRVSYDDEHIYFDYTYEGNLSDLENIPNMSPFIMTAIFLPDKAKYDYGFESILGSGGVLGYLPGNKIPCSYDMLKGSEIVESVSSAECEARGNHVMFSLDRSSFDAARDEFNLIAMNAYIVSPEEGRKFVYGPILKTVSVEYVVSSRQVFTMGTCTLDSNNIPTCSSGGIMTFDHVERRDETQEYNPVTVAGRLYDANYFTKVKFVTRSYEVP